MSPEWVMKIDDAVTRFAWRNFGGFFGLSKDPGTIIATMDGRLIPLSESRVAFSNKEKGVDVAFFCVTAGISVFNLTKASNIAKIPDLKGTGEYGKVHGHHVHSKAAFVGDVNYDYRKGFSISQDFMERNGLNHQKMTAMQHKLFKELAQSGRPNTLAEHTRIAKEALKAGGASQELADKLIGKSLENLAKQGVIQPYSIPWYQK